MNNTVSLRENHLFRHLYRRGTCKVTPCVAVYFKKNGRQLNRLGITASKKIGNAVQRNRARRVIREAYRLLESEVPVGLDIVMVARKKAVCVKTQAVQHCLRQALVAERQVKND
jgi:ribonuclease P protein component, eubacterial